MKPLAAELADKIALLTETAPDARALEKKGIADPDKPAVVGRSYGGYAALQATVIDPDLFKAMVAIAPVTSLAMLKREARDYMSSRRVERFVGDSPHIEEGSPLRDADTEVVAAHKREIIPAMISFTPGAPTTPQAT